MLGCVKTWVEEEYVMEEAMKEMEKAATVVQTRARSHSSRKELAALKEEAIRKEAEERASVLMQAASRGRIDRKALEEKQYAAAMVQSAVRGSLGRQVAQRWATEEPDVLRNADQAELGLTPNPNPNPNPNP